MASIDGSNSRRQQSNGSGNAAAAYAGGALPTAKHQNKITGQVTWSHRVIFGGAGQIVRNGYYYLPLPGFRVAAGQTVRLRAANGAATGNAFSCVVGDSLDMIIATHGTVLQPGDDVAWPADNLARVWVGGSNNDGIVVSVISNSQNFS